MERLKQPKRSPASESAPHWRTMAPGWYVSTTLEIIYKKLEISSKQLQQYHNTETNKLGLDMGISTRTYSFKKSGEASVIYSILEWNIDSIKLAFSLSYFLQHDVNEHHYSCSFIKTSNDHKQFQNTITKMRLVSINQTLKISLDTKISLHQTRKGKWLWKLIINAITIIIIIQWKWRTKWMSCQLI